MDDAVLELNLEYPPSTNRVWRMAHGQMIQDPKAKAWKLRSAWKAKAAGAQVIRGAVRVSATLHPKIARNGKPYKRRIDLDNAMKATLDALNGVCWQDDSQIESMSIDVGEGKRDGGITVMVYANSIGR